MKTNAKKLSIVLFTLATAFFGCKKENMLPLPGAAHHESASAANLNTTASGMNTDNKGVTNMGNGFWKINAFYLHQPQTMEEKGAGQTVKFRDWIFLFNNDGKVFAVKNSERVTGTWSRGTGNAKTDEITLNFGAQAPFNLLNNTWHLRESSKTWKFLEDKNDSDGTTGYVVFSNQK